MMSMNDALSAAQTEHYFDEHSSVDDYYTQGERCVGQWIEGAADLGLASNISREEFSALLQAFLPIRERYSFPPQLITASIAPAGTASSRPPSRSASRRSLAATTG